MSDELKAIEFEFKKLASYVNGKLNSYQELVDKVESQELAIHSLQKKIIELRSETPPTRADE